MNIDTGDTTWLLISTALVMLMTPAAGFVGVQAAILIGLGAGVFCYWAVQFKARLGVDDSLDVWGIHGVGGVWML